MHYCPTNTKHSICFDKIPSDASNVNVHKNVLFEPEKMTIGQHPTVCLHSYFNIVISTDEQQAMPYNFFVIHSTQCEQNS